MDEKMKILWDLFIVLPACSVALIGVADAAIHKLISAAQKGKTAVDTTNKKG